MKRTISMSMGKGHVRHNRRDFHAENTDPSRSHLNRSYVDEDIKAVYHQLFDAALQQYNRKQTRADRHIQDYYQKICSSKQEKPFYELIVQVGNLSDCGASTPEGQIAAQILEDYMTHFSERNPNLRVFSAHLHMDEATPHLHIDFIPFTTQSKRGLETRVSLKQALARQGFQGGTRGDTEWNQWVEAEKQHLAQEMQAQGIAWAQKGTHHKHLSVLDFKKQERSREVECLSRQVQEEQTKLAEIEQKTVQVQNIAAISAKPALLQKNKVIVSESDFEDIKQLAQKHIAQTSNTSQLQEENHRLKTDNQALRQHIQEQQNALLDLQGARKMEQWELAQLKQSHQKLKHRHQQILDFLDTQKLQEKAKAFLGLPKHDTHRER